MAEHFAHVVRGTGPAVLLAHGAGGGIEGNYGPILDDLAGTHTVVGPDYPGSGATPRSAGPLHLDDLADGLVRTAVDAGVDRFTVLGYSLGAAVAVRIATRHAQRVTGLVLTAGFARPDNRLRLVAQVWRALLDTGDRELTARCLTLVATAPSRLAALEPDALEAGIAGLGEFLPPGSPEQVDLAASVDVREELGRVAAPTLVVATAEDLITGPDLSRELAEGIPGAELVEIPAGHSPGSEAPDEWLAAIRSLLARVG